MSPERWQLVEQLYLGALKQPPSERGVYLDRLCHGDEELRQEVQSLLRHTESNEGLLDRPAWQVAPRPGSHVGPYLIEAFLGAGGMGEVYRARDSRLNRSVAIKFISVNLSGEAARRRFLREAQ